MLLKLID